MAETIHLFLDGIPGESAAKGHEREIEVETWRWGARAARASGGSGRRRGRARPADLHVVHRYDVASPLVLRALARGTTIPRARLSLSRSAGKGSTDYLVVTMTEVVVTRVRDSGDTEGSFEEVSLDPATLRVDYTPTTAKGGAGTPATVEWDIAAGTVT